MLLRCFSPLLAGVLLTTISFSSLADALGDGLAAAERRDFKVAYEIWKPLADNGDSNAQFYLASLFSRGLGVARNEDAAYRWMLSAAQGGFAPAQFNIGNHWVRTLGETGEAYRKGMSWWKKAAEGGFAPAQHNLGMLYLDGRIVERDERQAREWLTKAAAGGSTRSKSVLAELTADAGERPSKIAIKPVPPPLKPTETRASDRTERAASGQDEGEGWIGRQRDSAYTLQVFSGSQEDSARRVAASIPADLPRATYRFRRDGKPLFGVIVGVFDDAAAAKQIVGRLPENLVKARPWARRFGDVQFLIRTY